MSAVWRPRRRTVWLRRGGSIWWLRGLVRRLYRVARERVVLAATFQTLPLRFSVTVEQAEVDVPPFPSPSSAGRLGSGAGPTVPASSRRWPMSSPKHGSINCPAWVPRANRQLPREERKHQGKHD